MCARIAVIISASLSALPSMVMWPLPCLAPPSLMYRNSPKSCGLLLQPFGSGQPLVMRPRREFTSVSPIGIYVFIRGGRSSAIGSSYLRCSNLDIDMKRWKGRRTNGRGDSAWRDAAAAVVPEGRSDSKAGGEHEKTDEVHVLQRPVDVFEAG